MRASRVVLVVVLDIEPDWSPTGAKIAFMSTRDGNEEVYVMNRNGANELNLTKNPSRDERGAAWSPDGQRIAFNAPTGQPDISVMNADGSSQTQIISDGINYLPDWQPLSQSGQGYLRRLRGAGGVLGVRPPAS